MWFQKTRWMWETYLGTGFPAVAVSSVSFVLWVRACTRLPGETAHTLPALWVSDTWTGAQGSRGCPKATEVILWLNLDAAEVRKMPDPLFFGNSDKKDEATTFKGPPVSPASQLSLSAPGSLSLGTAPQGWWKRHISMGGCQLSRGMTALPPTSLREQHPSLVAPHGPWMAGFTVSILSRERLRSQSSQDQRRKLWTLAGSLYVHGLQHKAHVSMLTKVGSGAGDFTGRCFTPRECLGEMVFQQPGGKVQSQVQARLRPRRCWASGAGAPGEGAGREAPLRLSAPLRRGWGVGNPALQAPQAGGAGCEQSHGQHPGHTDLAREVKDPALITGDWEKTREKATQSEESEGQTLAACCHPGRRQWRPHGPSWWLWESASWATCWMTVISCSGQGVAFVSLSQTLRRWTSAKLLVSKELSPQLHLF